MTLQKNFALELSHLDSSNEGSKHMLSLKNKKKKNTSNYLQNPTLCGALLKSGLHNGTSLFQREEKKENHAFYEIIMNYELL